MITSERTGSESVLTPRSESACCIAQANAIPITRPTTAPRTATITASTRTIRFTCVRAIPTARSSPSSCTRS